jgi:uncharacterized protein YyaL (SSP411 family)
LQRFLFVMAWLACGAADAAAPASAAAPLTQWHAWNAGVFAEARAQQRFVLLDLEAVWCHWCHVMDQTTYQDHEVTRLIGERYIAVRVDQDADPALAARYQDYGWPATIVFAADGSEIVKRRGYLPPDAMAAMLAAIIKDPSPGPSVLAASRVQPSSSGTLTAHEREELTATYLQSFDSQYAGWGSTQKFIDADSLEYALAHAKSARAQAAMARRTLAAATSLIDPVWGGVYQYSDQRDWKSPHFEKLMSFQTQYVRAYAQGYRVLGDVSFLTAAQRIDRYVESFLTSPAGAVFTSQDADVDAQLTGHVFYAMNDAERRRHPQPRVDTHVYARENGWEIAALAALYDVTGDARYIVRARRAATWVSAHRSVSGGGFSHGGEVEAPPALGDTLAMGQGLLALYVATGERAWLAQARQAVQFIDSHFADSAGGYASAPAGHASGVFKEAVRDVDENIAVARLGNALYRYAGDASARRIARHAMRYLASAQIANGERLRTGILSAEEELAGEPTHVTIVGHKDDAGAQTLHAAALRYPALYRRIDWWDKREGAMPNPDVRYPQLARAAAFICSGSACSLPVFSAGDLVHSLDVATSPP